MQIMKVEIGGDTNSTSGAEPSHEHTRGAVNCDRGYEWWLMGQAKARNPNIKLVGLAWGAPGWIGNGNFWSNDSIDYLVAWLGCATSHGLTIDYLGGWNETRRDTTWYKNLRSALNSRGYAQREDRGVGRLRLGRRRRRAARPRVRHRRRRCSAATTSAATAARRPTARARPTP